jgi:Zn-dependent M28 family amino/carboxypeptidase
MDTYVQPFEHLFHQVKRINVKGPDSAEVYVISLLYNPGTPLPGGITGELVNVPVDDVRGSGCFEDQWQGLDVKGKIPLVKRGTCAFADKVKIAKQLGASAVIFYNNAPGKNISGATLQAGNVGKLVPSGLITLEDGETWSKRLTEGDTLKVTLIVDAVMETRPCYNIISETKEGDANNVVMLGAHLDSVLAGPGVNDDGSGTAALLEIMGSFKKYKGFKNKVRFAWWGAEE